MRVLLGVCGGVAAYKAAELLRVLQRRGISVRVVMTESAMQFVQPLTFAALSGQPVLTSLWQPSPEGSEGQFPIEHIAAVQGIDALVIAPATANHIARFASGLSDDLLATAYLAATVPVVLAPSMNVGMWKHAATQHNLDLLRARGNRIVAPGAGYLACGMVGDGRLAEVEAIADEVEQAISPKLDLLGETVLVTAGGTREPVDAVRYLGNRSSGKMGFALAEAAAARGARVHLVSAAQRPGPSNVCLYAVDTAEQMREAALHVLPQCTLVFKAAAVADFRPVEAAVGKLGRFGSVNLTLAATPDIVRELAARREPHTPVVAFAAEVDGGVERAREKLVRKGVDAIFVNDVSQPDIGFGAEENAGTLLTPEKTMRFAKMPKRQLADRLLDEAVRLRAERTAALVARSS